MDGLLEKFVPGGHRGVQLIAYSWELADSILAVGGGGVLREIRKRLLPTNAIPAGVGKSFIDSSLGAAGEAQRRRSLPSVSGLPKFPHSGCRNCLIL
jgi:hypothetical protein